MFKTIPEKQQEPITIKTYTSYIDDYGQKQTDYTEKNGSMFIKKFSQSINENDVRYNDVELIGLTKEEMTTMDHII